MIKGVLTGYIKRGIDDSTHTVISSDRNRDTLRFRNIYFKADGIEKELRITIPEKLYTKYLTEINANNFVETHKFKIWCSIQTMHTDEKSDSPICTPNVSLKVSMLSEYDRANGEKDIELCSDSEYANDFSIDKGYVTQTSLITDSHNYFKIATNRTYTSINEVKTKPNAYISVKTTPDKNYFHRDILRGTVRLSFDEDIKSFVLDEIRTTIFTGCRELYYLNNKTT